MLFQQSDEGGTGLPACPQPVVYADDAADASADATDVGIEVPDVEADVDDAATAAASADLDGCVGPGWGATLGLFGPDARPDAADTAPDHVGSGAAGPLVDAHADCGPGWGAVRGDVAVPRVGPFWGCLEAAQTAVAGMWEALDARSVPASEVAEVTVRLHVLDSRVRAVHAAALAQTVSSGGLPVGAVSAVSWVRGSHLLDGSRAATLV
ncbi:MAG: hypothetical protein QG597_2877, partial [Actinomycetota bacterium]|nr:hypothetical protein [Actinomycetota bacterium]